ncbi:hypothetical protein GCM10007298_08300 [Williamsia phyllosphaerae]|uniref:Sortase family protein n=2 Tax=Williamsia phyllosphaerae TaxID=885042 RepID=A0ABQ1UB42_9NOCA|nr:hypothetical protein GCM10007298_08300 [Williamsia phyllosphaerae]
MTGCAAAPDPTGSEPAAAQSAAAPAPAARPAPVAVAPPPSRVVVPAIDLDEPLIDLGIAEDGEMEVPADYGDVGWFTGGGRPGARGPTVLAGHVDSTTGPAVFARLAELTPGAEVTLVDTAGATAVYRVERTGEYGKDRFPTGEVFGAIAADEIRLITCGGDFDSDAGSYERNVVVFGVRV